MKIVVMGAGATGLVTAYLCAKNGCDVQVVEAAPVAGGLLSTFDVGNGSRLEHFYHHFFTHDAEINWLFAELGLQDKVVFRSTSMGILRAGEIFPFNGAVDLARFRAIGVVDRIRFGLTSAMLMYQNAHSDADDQPALAWFRKMAGKAATEAVWQPLLRCKFGDAAERIPLAWIAGRLRQRSRSRRGMSEQLGYLRGSLGVLVDRLLERLSATGAGVQLSTTVQSLIIKDGAVRGVETSDGILDADAVVSTLPTTALAKLVRPVSERYSDTLASIRYLGAICVILATRKPISPVYWLNIADPDFDFGGVVEQTNFVPSSDYGGLHITYLSRYMTHDHELWNMDDRTLVKRQIHQLGTIFKCDVSDQVERTWVFRAANAAPLTEVGFHRKIPAFISPISGLYVGSMCHVYPDERSVNNCVRVAAAVVGSMGLDSSFVPAGISLAAKFGWGQTAKESALPDIQPSLQTCCES